MHRPKVIVLRTAGTNCDTETVFAFKLAGADVKLTHINELTKRNEDLNRFHILAIPGGFTYGDDIAAGKILSNELKYKLSDSLKEFIDDGKLIIGICNGFQVLVKAGILPGNRSFKQEATLMANDSGKFEDRWVYLKNQKCVWTKNLPEIIYLPVAHGEGKFITKDKSVLMGLKRNKQIVLSYCDRQGLSSVYPLNPNGSEYDVAGICDKTGRIFGLMPHPERHILSNQHPQNLRIRKKGYGDGFQIFINGVEYAKKNL